MDQYIFNCSACGKKITVPREDCFVSLDLSAGTINLVGFCMSCASEYSSTIELKDLR